MHFPKNSHILLHILELDIFSGKILFNQNIKFKNIDSINFYNDFIIVTNTDGKIIIYKQ